MKADFISIATGLTFDDVGKNIIVYRNDLFEPDHVKFLGFTAVDDGYFDYILVQRGTQAVAIHLELIERVELVAPTKTIFDDIREIHKEVKVNQYSSYCTICQDSDYRFNVLKEYFPCETIKLLNDAGV
jgi:hypothetical protein